MRMMMMRLVRVVIMVMTMFFRSRVRAIDNLTIFKQTKLYRCHASTIHGLRLNGHTVEGQTSESPAQFLDW